MELRDFLPIPDLEGCTSLLCVQPHPDDNEVGAGGTIARLAGKGCKITYLTVTDGRNGTTDPGTSPVKLAEQRKREATEAAGILGVRDLIFLGYPDGGFTSERELCRDIVSAIRDVKPEFVLTVDPYLPYEAHPDHRASGLATAQACLFSAFPHFYSGGEKGPQDMWQVKGIGFYATSHPNTFINIDDTWELKVKAVSAHASQFAPAYLDAITGYFDFKARRYAEGRGFTRAEAFKVLSTSHLHMNVDTLLL